MVNGGLFSSPTELIRILVLPNFGYGGRKVIRRSVKTQIPLYLSIHKSVYEFPSQTRVCIRGLKIHTWPSLTMQCPQTLFEDSKAFSIQLLSDVKVTHGSLGFVHEAKATGQGLPDHGEVGILFCFQSTDRFGCYSIHCNE